MIFDLSRKTALSFVILTLISGIYAMFNASMIELTILLLMFDYFYLFINYQIQWHVIIIIIIFGIAVCALLPESVIGIGISMMSMALLINYEHTVRFSINRRSTSVIYDILKLKKLVLEQNHYLQNTRFIQPLIIAQWPRTLQYGTFIELLDSDMPVDLKMSFEYVPDIKLLKLLESERETLESELASLKHQSSSRYTALKLKHDSVMSMQQYLLSRHGNIFRTNITFYALGTDYKKMRKVTMFVKSVLQRHLFTPAYSTFLQKSQFLEYINIGHRTAESDMYVQSQAIAALYPFFNNTIIMKHGILWGINDTNNTPLIPDIWSFPASHMLVAGATGFGKSYFVKLLLIRALMHDPELRVFVIDPMGEYVTLTNALNGSVIDLHEKVINPFDLHDSSIEAKISNLKILFSTLFTLEKNDLALLDLVLNKLYDSTDTPTFDDLIEILPSPLKVLFDSLAKGSIKHLNNRTNIDLSARLVVFNIKNVNVDMLSFYMVLAIEYLYAQIMKDHLPKMLIIDEAWKLLKNSESSKLINEMLRHVRRWKCSMTLISQKIDDFMEEDKMSTILQNAMFHVMFKHNYISEKVQSFYTFSNREKEYIVSMTNPKKEGFARAYLIAGTIRVPMKIYSTNFENSLITTHPDDF